MAKFIVPRPGQLFLLSKDLKMNEIPDEEQTLEISTRSKKLFIICSEIGDQQNWFITTKELHDQWDNLLLGGFYTPEAEQNFIERNEKRLQPLVIPAGTIIKLLRLKLYRDDNYSFVSFYVPAMKIQFEMSLRQAVLLDVEIQTEENKSKFKSESFKI